MSSRILYADADAIRGQGARAALGAADVDVAESVAAVRAHLQRAAYGLVIVDHGLPEIGGVALLEALRAAGELTPALLVTAPGDDATPARAIDAGAIDFLVRSPDWLAQLPGRVHAARARAARAPMYQQIVEQTDDGIWMIDAAARTSFVNPRMAAMLGYTAAEMLGRGLFDFMDEAGVAISTRNLARRRDGIAEAHEFEFRRKDGAPFYALLTTNPIFEAGQYRGALAVVHDIGARKRAEADLRATQERFHSLFEHSPICLWEEDGSEFGAHLAALRASGVTDMRAHFQAHPEEVGRCFGMVKVINVNQAAVQQYEARDKDELIHGLARVLTPESHAVLTEELIALADGQTVFEAESVDQTLTGRKNHILLKTLVAPGSEATLSRVYVSIVDISARKRAEERVRKLASFPLLAPNAVLELDADGAIAYANPASEAMAATLGAPLAALLPAATPDIVAACLATGAPRAPLETRHGARTLSWSFHPVTAERAVHCYAADITERLHLEEQLRQSQKMDAIGHLAGGIAHDFNNLLTVIHGNTTLLQRARSSPEVRATALEYIARSTDRAATLVRQLLTFSRQQVLQPRDLDLNVVVVDLVKWLERVVREDVQVQLDLVGQPVRTRADAGMLEQVLMNLVVNARDAMPDGGSLVLATSEVTVTADTAPATSGLPPGRYACVRVTDTGHGIAPEHLERVFEPFFTTKEIGKGTGLGLATAFGIVKQHGGALTVTREVPRGTSFHVYLPAVAAAAPATGEGAAAPISEPAGGTESILVVEDEEPVRRLVQQVLELHGYRVQVVSTGAAALSLTDTAAFDLVLTDVVMPGGVSGQELAERLRRTKPGLKVIYMSGYTGETAAPGLELQEGRNFLPKPFGPTPLLACVRECLDHDA